MYINLNLREINQVFSNCHYSNTNYRLTKDRWATAPHCFRSKGSLYLNELISSI